MPSCPAILIAAPASGQGKTTITSALARLHTRQGRRVRVFKCGPDFLDPYWHSLASGAPVYQLDLWITGEPDCRQRLHDAAQEADLIIVEGVMGLFDGNPSAADLSQHFGLPVLAVIDASAMAGTFAAIAFGLQHYRPNLPWAGVLANRVGSVGHGAMLSDAPNYWGALLRNPALQLPERHLGLTVANELPDALERLDAAADALADTALGKLQWNGEGDSWQRWSVEFPAPHTATPIPPLLQNKTIAIAQDAAFCFIYAANLDCLRAMGAKLVFFSPLADHALPDCDAVWLTGGYPELHAAQLAANTALRDNLQAHIAQHKPVWAECGGMMALFDTLITTEGESLPFWGLLSGTVTMQKRLAALGSQQLCLEAGTVRGHTFHYSVTDTPLQPIARTSRPNTEASADKGEAVWQQGSVRASYFHAWFPSCPEAVAGWFV
jgi:cobyrinic acid a,c-diamide synthase